MKEIDVPSFLIDCRDVGVGQGGVTGNQIQSAGGAIYVYKDLFARAGN